MCETSGAASMYKVLFKIEHIDWINVNIGSWPLGVGNGMFLNMVR